MDEPCSVASVCLSLRLRNMRPRRCNYSWCRHCLRVPWHINPFSRASDPPIPRAERNGAASLAAIKNNLDFIGGIFPGLATVPAVAIAATATATPVDRSGEVNERTSEKIHPSNAASSALNSHLSPSICFRWPWWCWIGIKATQ